MLHKFRMRYFCYLVSIKCVFGLGTFDFWKLQYVSMVCFSFILKDQGKFDSLWYMTPLKLCFELRMLQNLSRYEQAISVQQTSSLYFFRNKGKYSSYLVIEVIGSKMLGHCEFELFIYNHFQCNVTTLLKEETVRTTVITAIHWPARIHLEDNSGLNEGKSTVYTKPLQTTWSPI